jgi:hypothetical protein
MDTTTSATANMDRADLALIEFSEHDHIVAASQLLQQYPNEKWVGHAANGFWFYPLCNGLVVATGRIWFDGTRFCEEVRR